MSQKEYKNSQKKKRRKRSQETFDKLEYQERFEN